MANIVSFRTLTDGLTACWQHCLNWVYPPECAGCGCVGEQWWCSSCLQRTSFLSDLQQTKWLSIQTRKTDPTEQETHQASEYRLATHAVAEFTPLLQEGIHRFKYKATPQLAQVFGSWCVRLHPVLQASRVGVLLPVPLHPKRLRARGFNQSQLLAEVIGKQMGLPVLPNMLRRVRQTNQQAKLDKTERLRNVAGAFAADKSVLQYEHICVVDDVFTTGATLTECARCLLESGVQQVSALTLARV